METAVIYARFSSHGQNEQSIEAQVHICKEFAESRELKVINVYPDKARTGTNDARPSFQCMITDAESGAFKYIIVYMFDRFARNRRDSIMYKEMLKEKYGIRVLSALEPIAEDEGGEFYEMFLEWNAEKYSKRLSKRVRDGLDISVSNGTFCGGYLIYGYKIELEPISGKPNKFVKRVMINEEESFALRHAFTEYSKGISKKELADAFVKAKSTLLQNTIERKMQEYEILLGDLELQKAQLELERGYKVTRSDLIDFIAKLIKGDINDKEYQKTIIDHLVSQVFVGDDDTVVFFNIRGGKGIATVTFEETKKAIQEAKCVQTQFPPSRHEPRSAQIFLLRLGSFLMSESN